MFVEKLNRDKISEFSIPNRIFTKSVKKIEDGIIELEMFSEDFENLNIIATDFEFVAKNAKNISEEYYSKCLADYWRNFIYSIYGEEYKKEYAVYLLEGVNKKLGKLGMKRGGEINKEKGV